MQKYEKCPNVLEVYEILWMLVVIGRDKDEMHFNINFAFALDCLKIRIVELFWNLLD